MLSQLFHIREDYFADIVGCSFDRFQMIHRIAIGLELFERCKRFGQFGIAARQHRAFVALIGGQTHLRF